MKSFRLFSSVQRLLSHAGSCREGNADLRGATWHPQSVAGAIALGIAMVLTVAPNAAGQEIVTPYGTASGMTAGAESSSYGVTTTTGGSQAKAPSVKPFRAARLSYLKGEVRVDRANSTTDGVAAINMPLVEGTVISSGGDGEAEIEFEDGSVARITPNSGLSLLKLSVDGSGTYHTRIAVLGGLAYFELRAGTKYEYSVDAGGDDISPVENATVRVNFDQPPAVIAVLDGTVHVAAAGGGAGTDASAGETVRANAGSEGGVYTISSAVAGESWDRWNEDRDAAAAGAEESETGARTKFAGSQGYGWSDLDANGTWYDVPGHGEVWQPDVAVNDQGAGQDGDAGGDANEAGFDPYGYGSWAWTPAGYSFASGYGWGWLPYRCGQWSWWDGFGWAWSPSPVCGLFGYGGYGYGGYGYGVNLGNRPEGYHRPKRPVPGPGPIQPILRGPRGIIVPGETPHGISRSTAQPRMIAGSLAEPLARLGTGSAAGSGSLLGSALRRDYPVDPQTHRAVMGAIATQRDATVAWPNANPRAARQPYVPQTGTRGEYTASPRGSGGASSSSGQTSRPEVQGGGHPAPVQRQGGSPAPHAAPAAPAAHGGGGGGSAKGK